MIIISEQNKDDVRSRNLISIRIWRFAKIIFDEHLSGTGIVLLFCTHVKSHKSHSSRNRLSFFPPTNVYLMYLVFQIV